MKSKQGVYKLYHKNLPELFYIGSTAVCFKKRFAQHVSLIKCHNHHIERLIEIGDKYGLSGFTYDVVEFTNASECRNREEFYIELLKPPLNTTKQDRYEIAFKETYQFLRDGSLVKRYRSIKEAALVTGIDRGSINNCLLKNRETAGGFQWSHQSICEPILATRKIIQYSMNGNKIAEYPSLSAIMEKLNLTSSTAIRNCFVGKQKQAYGFKWEDTHPKQAIELGLSETAIKPKKKP